VSGGGGAVVWITGLPSSGKSTLARALAARLRERGAAAAVLDGDEVRAALHPTPGHGPEERAAFYATLGDLAALLAGQGLVAIVAATGHRRAYRDRTRAAARRFVEVLVDVPASTCAARDTKGLWGAARAGAVTGLPGHGVEYEPPLAPEVVASGGADAAALERILALVRIT
jgi:adenylylsulfate kinase